MPRPKSYEEIEDGIPFDVELKENIFTLGKRKKVKTKCADMNFSCCDCGLVHNIAIVPSKTKVKVLMNRDNRRTGQTRRHVDFPMKSG
jgi:hypothetical protein